MLKFLLPLFRTESVYSVIFLSLKLIVSIRKAVVPGSQPRLRLSADAQRATKLSVHVIFMSLYRGAERSLARPRRKQAAATEDFEFHISYL